MIQQKLVKLFLRLSLSAGFLSAVADRLGYWSEQVSAWGNWNSFLEYTQIINTIVPKTLIPFLGFTATLLEVIFALSILIGFKTEFFAKLSGFLLLFFAIAMSTSTGVKGTLDYSVFTASAAAFALSLIKEKYFEIDILLKK